MQKVTRELVGRFFRGDRRACARLITMVECESPEVQGIIKEIYPKTGSAHIIGVTGSPGVGKSTFVDKLTLEYRKRGMKVGIIAVDPTSPFTGGALLGDRIRMCRHGTDDGVFIRSMGNRGYAGGIAGTTSDVAKLLDAFGMDTIIIETVGAGQSEVGIANIGHTLVVVTAPGLGDDIQFLKAGILEIGDIFIVNKSDMDGADQTAADLRLMLSPAHHDNTDKWKIRVLKTVAKKESDNGMPEARIAIDEHEKYIHKSGIFEKMMEEKCRAEIVAIAQRRVRDSVSCELGRNSPAKNILHNTVLRKIDPYTAVESVLRKCGFSRMK